MLLLILGGLVLRDNYLVTQDNNLIEARHKKPLTVREQKIVLTMVSMIQPTDEDFKEYRISVKKFSEMLELKGSVKYTQMKEVAENLMTKTIEIPKKDGGWILVNWIASAEYKTGEGVINLSFSPKLKPYMLQLKNQFTTYRLSNILNLNSSYSIRLYELMKKWQNIGRWECSVDNLRDKMGVEQGSYPRYANLKARVLNTAITEVNEKTDVHISFNEIKKGRRVDRVEFVIRHTAEKKKSKYTLKNELEESRGSDEIESIRIHLNELADKSLYQFTQTFFSEIYASALLIWKEKAVNELELLIRYVNEEKSVKNPLGFIKSQIQLSLEAHERGGNISFTDLKPMKERKNGREEIIPDWLANDRSNNEEKDLTDEAFLESRRLALKLELEEMSNRKRTNNLI